MKDTLVPLLAQFLQVLQTLQTPPKGLEKICKLNLSKSAEFSFFQHCKIVNSLQQTLAAVTCCATQESATCTKTRAHKERAITAWTLEEAVPSASAAAAAGAAGKSASLHGAIPS